MTQYAAPLRLVDADPLERLVRTLEALLVIASAPLTAADLADATEEDEARVEGALHLVGERYSEGRSGIVLEHVAGGYAFRAARAEAAACARLVERPVERGLSQAALETLAIVAYLGPCTRPDIARVRGVAADTVVAGLVERGLVSVTEEVADRRVRLVTPTPAGAALLGVFDRARADQFLSVVRPLPMADRAMVAMGVASLASRAMSRRGRLIKAGPRAG